MRPRHPVEWPLVLDERECFSNGCPATVHHRHPFPPDAVISVRPPVPGICRWDSLQQCSLDPVQPGFGDRAKWEKGSRIERCKILYASSLIGHGLDTVGSVLDTDALIPCDTHP